MFCTTRLWGEINHIVANVYPINDLLHGISPGQQGMSQVENVSFYLIFDSIWC